MKKSPPVAAGTFLLRRLIRAERPYLSTIAVMVSRENATLR